MIITVTANPAIDKTLEVLNFKKGFVNRSIKKREDIGGKGINVSKSLRILDVDSTALGFVGNNYKNDFQDKLNLYKIKNNLTYIKSDTRVNIKIVDSNTDEHTDINELGPCINEIELKDFNKKFKETVKQNSIVVISGSLPRGVNFNFYKNLICSAKESGAIVIFDAEGEALEEGIKALPHILKPNINELETLATRKFYSNLEIISYCGNIIKLGVKKILVSLGEKGSILVTKDKVYIIKGKKIEAKSTVGAGDSMVAAIAYGIEKNLNDKDILCLAQAMGMSSINREGSLPPKKDDIMRYFKISNKLIQEI